MTFLGLGVVAAFDEKAANVIVAVAGHQAAGEGEAELHPMPIARSVVIETRPGSGGEQIVAHVWRIIEGFEPNQRRNPKSECRSPKKSEVRVVPAAFFP
jgi:hypothetical protein